MYFKDRADAGTRLAAVLKTYCETESVIYALPRGGVVLGVEIAKALRLPLDLVIPRKVGHPYSPEYAIAAVTEHGVIAANEDEIENVDRRWFERAVAVEMKEAQRRRALYMEGRENHSATNKIAILVDDGIATGLTMKAAILDIKNQSPAKVVVAVPVAPARTAQELLKMVDSLVALDITEYYLGAVGLYYAEFAQVTDSGVIEMLESVNPIKLAQI